MVSLALYITKAEFSLQMAIIDVIAICVLYIAYLFLKSGRIKSWLWYLLSYSYIVPSVIAGFVWNGNIYFI